MTRLFKSATVRKKRSELEKQVSLISDKIESLKSKCKHENLRFIYNGSSGNYDRDDSYWINWFCPDCLYRETTDYDRSAIEAMTQKLGVSPRCINLYDKRDQEISKDFYNPDLI